MTEAAPPAVRFALKVGSNMIGRIAAFFLIAAALIALLIGYQDREEPFHVSGFIEADEIRVGSRVGGRVVRVEIEEGQAVTRGDLLVELEPFDLLELRGAAQAEAAGREAELARIEAGFREEEIAQAKARRDQLAANLKKLEAGPRSQEIETARANVDLAKAELALAESEFERFESLFKTNVSPREALDRATQDLAASNARLRAREEELALLVEGTRAEDIEIARAQLEEAEQAWRLMKSGYRNEDIDQARASLDAAEAALASIDRQIGELKVTAPSAGIIEAVELRPGDLVAPNAPVLSIMDVSELWVRAYVPENRLDLRMGQAVEISVDSFPDSRFDGKITFISRQAEFTPGNVQTPEERSKQVFRIKVTLDQGLGNLRPGMAADVWFEPQGGGA